MKQPNVTQTKEEWNFYCPLKGFKKVKMWLHPNSLEQFFKAFPQHSAKKFFFCFFFFAKDKMNKIAFFLWQFGELFGSYTKYCTEQKNCTEYMKARYADNDLFKTFVVVSSSQSVWTLCCQTVHAVCERSCQRALLCSLLQSMQVMCHIRRLFN